MKTKVKTNLRGARNIGPTILMRLNEIGVYSLEDLAAITPATAYKMICAQNPDRTFPVCYYLYSLEGALLDLHWDDLPQELKRELKNQVR